MSILEELYFGNLKFSEDIPKGEEGQEHMRRLNELEEILLSNLNEEDRRYFQEYNNLLNDSYSTMAIEAFKKGFSFAFALSEEASSHMKFLADEK